MGVPKRTVGTCKSTCVNAVTHCMLVLVQNSDGEDFWESKRRMPRVTWPHAYASAKTTGNVKSFSDLTLGSWHT